MSSLFSGAAEITVDGYARVAVEAGVDRFPDGLTYAVPETLADLAPGERVVVPLGRGNRPTAGYVLERTDAPGHDAGTIKTVVARDEAAVRLPGELLALARWMAGYYCAPVGMALATMLPAAVKRRVGSVTRTLVDLAPDPPGSHKPTAKQRRVLELLEATPTADRPIELRRLQELAGLATVGPIRRLIDAGLLVASRRTAVHAAWADRAVSSAPPPGLTGPQRCVVDAVGATIGQGFTAHLLYGVTGAGKTEVYLRLIDRVVRDGSVALLLVPEISLTPQTGGRLLGRFPDRRVAILHSGLTAAQRHQQWTTAADGSADIVIGARSAVFAPVPDGRLGLIVVDEEHDGSYKQDQVPRYHGRDVAVRRAQLAGVPVLLGSATPSLESWHNATGRGSYRLHRLDERAPGLSLPRVRVVDFVEERRRRRDRRIHLLGPTLEGAIGRALEGGGQVLILLNRRGYASYIACPSPACGWCMTCPHCDVNVVYHRSGAVPAGGYVRCHHCLTEQRLPAGCPDCRRRLSTLGFGTQRVEEELTAKFPVLELGRTMLRLDSDTMSSARDYHDALDRFADGSVRALVGTQMIAKGLDYPGVRLVGVVNADTAVNLPDFRAAERTFQLVSQVAGRCGRGTAAGAVVVQTLHPEMPAIRLAAAHDFEGFAAGELEERRRCGLPPVTRLARIVVRHEDHDRAVTLAEQLAHGLGRLELGGAVVRGPAPCPIGRIAGRFRHQVELIAPDAAVLQRALTAARRTGLLHAD
jgi:primosomal protein N' (replication factor Y)